MYHAISQTASPLPEAYSGAVVHDVIDETMDSGIYEEELSPRIYQALLDHAIFEVYEVDYSMSPYFQRGDFNDDGDFDIAILLINKNDRRRSVVIMENDDFNIVVGKNNYTRVPEMPAAVNQKPASSFTNLTALFKQIL